MILSGEKKSMESHTQAQYLDTLFATILCTFLLILVSKKRWVLRDTISMYSTILRVISNFDPTPSSPHHSQGGKCHFGGNIIVTFEKNSLPLFLEILTNSFQPKLYPSKLNWRFRNGS